MEYWGRWEDGKVKKGRGNVKRLEKKERERRRKGEEKERTERGKERSEETQRELIINGNGRETGGQFSGHYLKDDLPEKLIL